jgi:Ca-activated chloride channel family protein
MPRFVSDWFTAPWIIWLFVFFPCWFVLAWWFARRRRRDMARWEGYGRPFSRGHDRARLEWLRRVLLLVGLAAVVLGIAGPNWGHDDRPETALSRDVVIALDMSRSMLAEDVLGKSAPNRLGRARDALVDLADALERAGVQRLALVVFAGRSQLVCPLTPDCDYFREKVAGLDPDNPELEIEPQDGSGTRIGAGVKLALATHEFERSGAQDIILISDGDDPAHDGEWQLGIEEAQGRHIAVVTVGIGDPANDSRIPLPSGKFLRYEGQDVVTRLQERPLMEIAKQTGGVYVPARTKALPLGKLFLERVAPLERQKIDEEALPVPRKHYPWFFGMALILLGLAMALEDRGRELWRRQTRGTSLSLVGAMLISAATVGGWPGDNVTRGNLAFERGDYGYALECYQAAAERATDPGLVAFNKAATFYRLERYAEAEQEYLRSLEGAAGSRLPKALFNLGNTLVQEARGQDIATLERALGYYDAALRSAREDAALAESVRHNMRIARELWLRAKEKHKAAKERASDEDESREARQTLRGDQGRRDTADNGSGNGGEPSRDGHGEGEERTGKSTKVLRPGEGNLSPVNDPEDAKHLSDVSNILRQVVARIEKDRRQHRTRTSEIGNPNVKDW